MKVHYTRQKSKFFVQSGVELNSGSVWQISQQNLDKNLGDLIKKKKKDFLCLVLTRQFLKTIT